MFSFFICKISVVLGTKLLEDGKAIKKSLIRFSKSVEEQYLISPALRLQYVVVFCLILQQKGERIVPKSCSNELWEGYDTCVFLDCSVQIISCVNNLLL